MSARTAEIKCACGWGPFTFRSEAPWSAVRLALWWQCPTCKQVWSTPLNANDGPPVQEPLQIGDKWHALPVKP